MLSRRAGLSATAGLSCYCYFVIWVDSLATATAGYCVVDLEEKLLRSLFPNICKPDSCLHHLLPTPSDTSVISRLRCSTSVPRPISWTKEFESFLNFALIKYQSPLLHCVTPLCYCYCCHCLYLHLFLTVFVIQPQVWTKPQWWVHCCVWCKLDRSQTFSRNIRERWRVC